MKKEIAKLLIKMESSLEDQYLSREERRELKTLIAQLNMDESQSSWLLSKFRDLAIEAASNKDSSQLLSWFYEGAKLVLVAERETDKTEERAFFSPGESCREAILAKLSSAKTSVDICVFTISDDIISKAVLLAHKRGVRVRIITDNDKSLDMGSDVEYLYKEGVPLRTDLTKVHMHHKFAIFDSEYLLTGSYNWTRSAATSNYENIVILNDPQLVRSFKNEFGRLWLSLARD